MTTVAKPRVGQDMRTRRGVRIAAGVALSTLSGVMLLLSFPPYGLWFLTWVAFVPYLLAQYRLLPPKRASLAPAIAHLIWLGPFMARLFGTQYGPVFTFLGVLIALITFFAHQERAFHERTGYRWFVLQGVIDWVGFEMLRATVIPLVATSAFIGYTQAEQAWLTQPVAIFSVYGLNLLIMLVNYALAQAAMVGFDRRWSFDDAVAVKGAGTRRWLAAAGGAAVVWVGLSLIMLNTAPETQELRVAAIQPNYEVGAFWDEINTSEVRVAAFADWAREAAQQGAQILYTPEMHFNFDPQVSFTEPLRALARETGAYLFLNYSYGVEGEPWRNEAVLLSPEGAFSEVYAKNHAPPGEPRSPTAGVYPVYGTPLGRLAAMICHDANYTDVARKLARNGAQLTSASLSEFGGFGEQYWTNVTFRALETRSSMVVTSRQNGSAIIDAYGRQRALAMNPGGEQVVLVGDVNLGTGRTPLLYLGDWLGWLSLAGYVGFVVFQSVEGRRAKQAQDAESTAA